MITKTIEMDTGVNTIIAGACAHIGNRNMHEEGFAKFIERCKANRWLHLGDLLEAITPDDPRFHMDEHKQSILQQAKFAVDQISEASDTCMGLITGNHERKLSRKVGCITDHMAKLAEVPSLGDTAVMIFSFPDAQYTGFFAHGSGYLGANSNEPERNRTNLKIRLRNKLRPFHYDIRGIAHFHREVIAEPVYERRLTLVGIETKMRPVHVQDNWAFTCPSMFRNYTEHGSYAEAALYGPTELGWIEFDVDSTGIKCVRHVDEEGITKREEYPQVY